MQNAIKLIATFFYIGYSPVARGTMSALSVLVVYYFVKDNPAIYVCTALFMILLGFLVSGKAEKIFGKKDAPEITIDDACGMLVALFLIPQNINYITAAFFMYRAFDILKVPPTRKIENLKGSSGIMLDDIIAGIYTNIILQTIHYTLSTIH